jgi:uncharacterized Tic20 family protein/DNA-binding Xre family transcriptional regulator
MNQPDLGLKVFELRQQKGLTQEQLAELCEVSTRTIQRIESGEVDPRAYTLNCLGESLEFDFSEESTGNENLWLAILHLSSTFCFFLIPLLLWSWKKNQSFKIDKQGRQVLNFQITMTLILFAAACVLMVIPGTMVLMENYGFLKVSSSNFKVLVLLAPLPLVITWLFCIFQGFINTIRSLFDKPIHYTLSIPFVK